MARRLATLATCNLDCWAMDFELNKKLIISSITEAKKRGATYRVGPELEVPGYGCEDHFTEQDTIDHSWEVLAEIIKEGHTQGIVCDVGLPITHRDVRYNCRVFVLDGKVLLIRPKIFLANDGNYREGRYFCAWKRRREVEQHTLPPVMREACQQKYCPIGDAALLFNDVTLAAETCEEMFTPQAPHIDLALSGVEIITNGSGSHHQMRKLDTRLELIRGATSKSGGVYLYANQQGCDGGNLYYDGCACIAVNGHIVKQGQQFDLREVEVVTATVDLDEVKSFRAGITSLQHQASFAPRWPLIHVDFDLCTPESCAQLPATAVPPRYHAPEEEIAYGPACWLWDYLRRSGASGFLLPLSGGADSSAVAAIVGCMTQLVVKAVQEGYREVEADARRVGQYKDGEELGGTKELANRLFSTIYMGTVNSSSETRKRAKNLAGEIGADHWDVSIDAAVDAAAALFATITGRRPRFRADGGSSAENLALQNVQARMRMVMAYMMASLLPWLRNRSGFMLVLGSSNVDEMLRGYLTKYDCSSADLNPIGGISKTDIRRFLKWAAEHLGYPELAHVEAAPPTAELEPIREGQDVQTDEADMGMTYEELGIYGTLRKIVRSGPVSMFHHLLSRWRDRYSPDLVAERVKTFFKWYSINRHKAVVATPAYHAEEYAVDDHRYDHRQFLYNSRWTWQFARIDRILDRFKRSGET